jgi:putative endonuclease
VPTRRRDSLFREHPRPCAQPKHAPNFNHEGYAYILASQRNGTLYTSVTGVTRDLAARLFDHQNELTPGFTSRYGVKTLVWLEEHDLLVQAIAREKSIRKWPREWTLNLIESMNPGWDDIARYLHGPARSAADIAASSKAFAT